jgi:hypothetical protein
MGHIFDGVRSARLISAAGVVCIFAKEIIEGKGDGLENLHRGFIQGFDERQLFPVGKHAEERRHPEGVA